VCGIVGFTHRGWTPERDRLRAAVATLGHRGPDQQGLFQSALCSMGATRLKIIDLDDGNQPISTEDGDTTIVFNGEIYNHRELRRELEGRGHRFRSRADTEVVLRAFVEWDTGCFSRLRGMFAVALWKASVGRLVLARDRLGIKPLYLARRGDDLLFASEMKAIFVHPEIERRLSLAGLDGYLSLNYVPCPWTLIEGIEKLPPAHWLEWRDGAIVTGAYWRLPVGVTGPVGMEAACEELDELLRESVREHLLSDVPLGIWLSGGIDSSTVLHYTAQAAGRRVKTFSIGFRGRSFDETAYIDRVVDRYGTDHEALNLSPEDDLQGAVEQFACYSDEPTADAGALPVWFLSKLTRKTATVALSGEGADELFGGYVTYRANRLARPVRSIPRTALRILRAACGAWPVSDEKISFEYKLKRFLDGCLLPAERAHVFWNGTFSAGEKASLLSQACPGALDRVLLDLRTAIATEPDDLAPYLWFDQKYFLPDDILTKVDRMSMAHSVEVRPPFLDHRLVEFASRLPASFKIRGRAQKVILKRLMATRLPPAILRRGKMGFDIPAHEWLRGPLRAMLIDTLQAGLSGSPGLFHPEVVQRHLRNHQERRTNVGYHLWGLMVLFLWMKHWRVQLPDRPATGVPLLATANLGERGEPGEAPEVRETREREPVTTTV
jgi:asparagine synthase (glutamine-hydrolysing)